MEKEVIYRCPRCGHELSDSPEDVLEGYKFYCPECDEDFFGIEAVEEEC